MLFVYSASMWSELTLFMPFLVSCLLKHVERGNLIRLAQPWKLRSRGVLLAGGLMAAPCDMIDLDCHSAQLGVIAW